MKLFFTLLMATAASAAGPIRAAEEAIPAPRAGHAAPRARMREKHWRYVWHNDRWWYWTPAESWRYFDGQRWRQYDPRRVAARSSAAYRKAPAFERPPAVAPRSPARFRDEAVDWIAPFDVDGRASGDTGTSQGGLLGSPPLSGAGGSGAGGIDSQPRRSGLAPGLRTPARVPTGTGNGGFGGPKGGSLGGGSAAGGASTPQ